MTTYDYDYIHPFPVVDQVSSIPQPSRTDGILYDLAGTAHSVVSLMDQPTTVTTSPSARLVPFRSDIPVGIVRFGSGSPAADPGTTVYSVQALNSLPEAEAAKILAANAQALAESAQAAAAQSALAAVAAQAAAEAAAAGGGGGGSGSVVITSEDSDGYVDVSGAGVVMTAEDSDGYVTLTLA